MYNLLLTLAYITSVRNDLIIGIPLAIAYCVEFNSTEKADKMSNNNNNTEELFDNHFSVADIVPVSVIMTGVFVAIFQAVNMIVGI